MKQADRVALAEHIANKHGLPYGVVIQALDIAWKVTEDASDFVSRQIDMLCGEDDRLAILAMFIHCFFAIKENKQAGALARVGIAVAYGTEMKL